MISGILFSVRLSLGIQNPRLPSICDYHTIIVMSAFETVSINKVQAVDNRHQHVYTWGDHSHFIIYTAVSPTVTFRVFWQCVCLKETHVEGCYSGDIVSAGAISFRDNRIQIDACSKPGLSYYACYWDRIGQAVCRAISYRYISLHRSHIGRAYRSELRTSRCE